VNLDTGGNPVSSLIFSVNYDQTWLVFDDVIWSLPDGYTAWYDHSAADIDGELDLSVYGNSYSGASSLPEGEIATIVFEAGSPDGEFLAQVVGSDDPVASFGGTSGSSLDGSFEGGSVWIFEWIKVFLPLTVR
jgi:hypothetical protein